MAAKGSGNIDVTRDSSWSMPKVMHGPTSGDTAPGAGGGETSKGSGNFTVDRSVKAPPTHGPAK